MAFVLKNPSFVDNPQCSIPRAPGWGHFPGFWPPKKGQKHPKKNRANSTVRWDGPRKKKTQESSKAMPTTRILRLSSNTHACFCHFLPSAAKNQTTPCVLLSAVTTADSKTPSQAIPPRLRVRRRAQPPQKALHHRTSAMMQLLLLLRGCHRSRE